MAKTSYYDFMRRSVDYDHLKKAKECAGAFSEEFNRDLVICWFMIRGEILKHYPNDPYTDMRTNAHLAILLVRLVKGFCADVDEDIKKRLGQTATTLNPKIKDLDTIMDGYVGNCDISRTELIQRSEIILRRAVDNIKYRE